MKLNLNAQLNTGPKVRKGPPCTMRTVLEALSDEDRGALEAALTDMTQPHAHIYRVLRENGVEISINTVHRHRRGECACGYR